jgi:hypothetical protein
VVPGGSGVVQCASAATEPIRLVEPAERSWTSITWLKASATEHVTRMRELVALLEHKAIAVEELRTERPGYVVYESDLRRRNCSIADPRGRRHAEPSKERTAPYAGSVPRSSQ